MELKQLLPIILLLEFKARFVHTEFNLDTLIVKNAWIKSEKKDDTKFPYAHCFDHLNHSEYPDFEVEGKNGILNPRFRWPMGRIPYAFSSEVTDSERAVIRRGMQLVMDKTCIRFVERTTEENFVGVVAQYTGCFSTGVGMRGGLQYVNLDPSGCMEDFVIAHEFIHVIGFWHEHTRTDRDDYIKVLWKDIQATYRPQYYKKSTKYAGGFGYAYDFNSIMHYPAYNSFGIDPKKPTMVSIVKNKKIPASFTGLMKITSTDAGKINAMYKNCKG